MDHLCCFCLVLLCFHTRLFVDALWSPAGKGLTSWLMFVMSNCDVVTFPFGILGQVWYLIVSIPDLCPLSYFSDLTFNTQPIKYICADLAEPSLLTEAIGTRPLVKSV